MLHHIGLSRRFPVYQPPAQARGYVVVGLYNAYSRQLYYARRTLFRSTGLTSHWLDPHFGKVSATGKREAWFQDQYCHPHETCHTLSEVLGWMDECDLEFINSIPKPAPGPALVAGEWLFARRDRGTALSRMLSQFAALGNGYREGFLHHDRLATAIGGGMIDPHIDDHAPVSTSTSTLRQFAGLCLLIFGGLAGWEYVGRDHQRLALLFAGLAVVLGCGGLAWPRGIRPVFVTAMALTMPIGMVVSRVLLGVLFFGLFTPVGLFFKRSAATPSPAGMPRSRRVTGSPSRAPPTYAATYVSPNLWRSR